MFNNYCSNASVSLFAIFLAVIYFIMFFVLLIFACVPYPICMKVKVAKLQQKPQKTVTFSGVQVSIQVEVTLLFIPPPPSSLPLDYGSHTKAGI